MQAIGRREFLGAAMGAALLSATISGESFAARRKGKLPNILFLIADDLGDGDLGCYGHPTIRTPNLDKLSSEGISFTNAFVTTSSCSPSRCCMFTGLYPHATGAEDLHVPLPADKVTLASYLREFGYYSMNVAKFHLGKNAAGQWDAMKDNIEDWRALMDERPKDRPFFFSVGFNDPHRPYQENTIPDPTAPEDVTVPPYLVDDLRTRNDLVGYYDEVARMDRHVGEMLKYLDENGLGDNTLVIFISDNGMPFPRAKTTCYDSGVRTPLIFRWPGHVPERAWSDALFSSVDLAPTILDIVGRGKPEVMQGHVMTPCLNDPNAEVRDYIYMERNWHNMDDHQRGCRDKRYKYIKHWFTQKWTIASDLIGSPSYTSLLEARDKGDLTRQQMRLFMTPRPAEELYDTFSDPYEFTNLASDPHYEKILLRMRAATAEWLEVTHDSPSEQGRVDNVDLFTRGKYGKSSGEPELKIYEGGLDPLKE